MKNLIKNILLLSLFISCASPIQEAVSVSNDTKIILVPDDTKADIPRVLNLKSLTGFNEKNKAEFLKAEIKANEIINGQCFADFMLNRKLIQTNRLDNLGVLNKIRSTPIEIDLISYNKSWSKVHGYTLANVKWIRVNYKYYNGSSVCAKASNMSHEFSHKQGFGHDYKPNKNRPYSVPYSINAAFKECCGE